MNPLREIFARFAVKFDTKELQRGIRATQEATGELRDADRAADGLGSSFKGMASGAGTALAGVAAGAAAVTAAVVAAGAAVTKLTADFAKQNAELGLNAQRLGISTDQMQALSLMAADAGQDTEKVTDAMSTLQERMRDAVQDPKSDPAVQLRALGIQIPKTMAEMPDAISLFKAASDGIAGMSNQTDRVGAAMTVFGDVGRELLPVLQRGGRAIDEYSAELKTLGGGVSANSITASKNLGFAMNRLDVVMTSVKDKVLSPLIPVLERASLEFGEMFTKTGQGEKTVQSLAEAATALGQAFVDALPYIITFATFSANAVKAFLDIVKELQGSLENVINTAAKGINTVAKFFGVDGIPEFSGERPTTNGVRRGLTPAQLAGGSGGGANVQQANTININGAGDPAAVAREVKKQMDRQNRSALEAVGV